MFVEDRCPELWSSEDMETLRIMRLVPFLLENPRVRITHQIPLWNVVYFTGMFRGIKVKVSHNITTLIGAAGQLVHAGVSPKAYTLFFDGQGEDEAATEAFCKPQSTGMLPGPTPLQHGKSVILRLIVHCVSSNQKTSYHEQ